MAAAAARHRRHALDDSDSDTEAEGSNTALSRSSSRSKPSASQRYASMLEQMRSQPVQDSPRQSQGVAANVSATAATLETPTTPRQGTQGSRSVTSRRKVHIAADFSPSPVAQFHTAHSQQMPPPATIQGDPNSPVAHSLQPSMQQLPWMMLPLSVELRKEMPSLQDCCIIISLVSSSQEQQEH